MTPLRFLITIARLATNRRVRPRGIWVSEDWLAEQQAKEFALGRPREVSTDSSTLVSERLSLVAADRE